MSAERDAALGRLTTALFGARAEQPEHGLVDPLAAFIRAGAVEPALASTDPKRRSEAKARLEHRVSESAKTAAAIRRQVAADKRLPDEVFDVFDADAFEMETLAMETESLDDELPLEDILPDEWA